MDIRQPIATSPSELNTLLRVQAGPTGWPQNETMEFKMAAQLLPPTPPSPPSMHKNLVVAVWTISRTGSCLITPHQA